MWYRFLGAGQAGQVSVTLSHFADDSEIEGKQGNAGEAIATPAF